MTDIERDTQRVHQIMERVEPLIAAFVRRTIEKDGHSVGLSVASNMGTIMLSSSLAIVANAGRDPEPFLRVLLAEIDQRLAMLQQKLGRPVNHGCHPLH